LLCASAGWLVRRQQRTNKGIKRFVIDSILSKDKFSRDDTPINQLCVPFAAWEF
jgi:hypothetical protein